LASCGKSVPVFQIPNLKTDFLFLISEQDQGHNVKILTIFVFKFVQCLQYFKIDLLLLTNE
jgi:hypothetical protein